jgi:hypothetical protein
LAEMARWPSLSYALPPFLLMGRLAGHSETAIQKEWAGGDRESVIRQALDTVIAGARRSGK